MNIQMNGTCYLCHLSKQIETARALGSDEQVTAFTRELMQAYVEAPPEASAPGGIFLWRAIGHDFARPPAPSADFVLPQAGFRRPPRGRFRPEGISFFIKLQPWIKPAPPGFPDDAGSYLILT